MSRFLSKHVARSRRTLALVLASEPLAQQPTGAARAALERALSQLTPEEQQLLVAAEIPGWPDRPPPQPSLGAPEQPFRSLLATASPGPDDWGVDVDAGAGGGDVDPSTLAAVAAALLPGARLETAAAELTTAPPAVAAPPAGVPVAPLGASRVHATAPALRAPPLPRPSVLPEVRLLWKAAAHELIRCRVEQTTRHEGILRAMGAASAAAAVLAAPTRVPSAGPGGVVDLCSDDDGGDSPVDAASAAASDRRAVAENPNELGDGGTKAPPKKRKAAAAAAAAAAASAVGPAAQPSGSATAVAPARGGLVPPAAAARSALPDGAGIVLGVGAAGAGPEPPLRLELCARPSTVAVFPLSRMEARASLLRDLSPSVIVMFDPDPAFTREVEVRRERLSPCRGGPLAWLSCLGSRRSTRRRPRRSGHYASISLWRRRLQMSSASSRLSAKSAWPLSASSTRRPTWRLHCCRPSRQHWQPPVRPRGARATPEVAAPGLTSGVSQPRVLEAAAPRVLLPRYWGRGASLGTSLLQGKVLAYYGPLQSISQEWQIRGGELSLPTYASSERSCRFACTTQVGWRREGVFATHAPLSPSSTRYPFHVASRLGPAPRYVGSWGLRSFTGHRRRTQVRAAPSPGSYTQPSCNSIPPVQVRA